MEKRLKRNETKQVRHREVPGRSLSLHGADCLIIIKLLVPLSDSAFGRFVVCGNGARTKDYGEDDRIWDELGG